MRRAIGQALALIAVLPPCLAMSQAADKVNQVTPSTSPVAYVYVSAQTGSGSAEIAGFAAAHNGALTPLPESPYAGNVLSMADNGKYLFGQDADTVNIDSFSVSSNGALQQVTSTNAVHGVCSSDLSTVSLDHTGATLYGLSFYSTGTNCLAATFQSYDVEKATGALQYLGSSNFGDTFTSGTYVYPISFIGNNKYAFGVTCYNQNSTIDEFQRHSNGLLEHVNIHTPFPVKKGDFYCPYLVTADPANHLAAYLQAFDATTGEQNGPPQIAMYSVSNSGTLTTSSTSANMAKVKIGGSLRELKMSPAGNLLALAATGVQLFHVNGSTPAKSYVTLLPNQDIDQLLWDNDNHLYVVSMSSVKLWVFTVTPTSVSQAPGSPHSLYNFGSLIVRPLTPRP